MNKSALKVILSEFEDQCFNLQLTLIERGNAELIAEQFQRALDNAQQRLDDARMLDVWHRHMENHPETMGNMFRAPRKHEP